MKWIACELHTHTVHSDGQFTLSTLTQRAAEIGLDAVALTEQGVGVSIFPQTTYTPNDLVVSRVIIGPARRAQYVMVRLRDRRPTALAQAFLDYVQAFLAEDRIRSERFRVRKDHSGVPRWEAPPPLLG